MTRAVVPPALLLRSERVDTLTVDPPAPPVVVVTLMPATVAHPTSGSGEEDPQPPVGPESVGSGTGASAVIASRLPAGEAPASAEAPTIPSSLPGGVAPSAPFAVATPSSGGAAAVASSPDRAGGRPPSSGGGVSAEGASVPRAPQPTSTSQPTRAAIRQFMTAECARRALRSRTAQGDEPIRVAR